MNIEVWFAPVFGLICFLAGIQVGRILSECERKRG
jgi:hypothetical protein